MGHEFHTKNNFLLPRTLVHGLEHIINYYVIGKLTMAIILGMQWLKTYNPRVDWPNYALTLYNSCSQ